MRRTLCLGSLLVFVIPALCFGSNVNFNGLVQVRYTESPGAVMGFGCKPDSGCYDRADISTFEVKTARLSLRAQPLKKLSVAMTVEFAGEPNLLDLMLDWEFLPNNRLMIGQFKLPFGYETQVPTFNLETIDRSLVVTHMWNNGVSSPYLRDLGVMLTGRYRVLNYSVAVVNGAGYDYSSGPSLLSFGRDNDAKKDVVGRVGLGIPFLAGFGFSFYQGKWEGTNDRNAYGFDIYLDIGRIVFQMEKIKGKGLIGSGWRSDEYSGWYVTVGSRLTPIIEPVFKYDKFDPTKTGGNDIITRMLFGLNLNFMRTAKFQLFYIRKNENPEDFDDNQLVGQLVARF